MTVWLTRITLNTRTHQARRDLRDVAQMHRTVMRLFPDGLGSTARASAGVLFRTEDTDDGPTLLIQSQIEPDATRLSDEYGTALTRSLDPLLLALRPGLPVRYRIIANATRKLGVNTQAGNPHRIVPLGGPEAELWWHRQAEQSGLHLRTSSTLALTSATGVRDVPEPAKPQPQRHARTQFDGTATITDADLLRQRLREGIGRGKSYGCGLLTLAPAR
ncbi:type I-E CRISPR-associated protein Cas6/Cse3/CasE [Catenulispora yoronensis]|uniref:Type I-E CRISPR-associated protein Cas6/Cse3/CasE n=1 Tax=Catenulispora yoronensis TaxID=450799 RepID=A0ABP5GQ49_9ACTN